jgi:hypothetical protein
MYKFVRVSANRKTGPIPVTYSSRATCPASCPHYRTTCYAESGPTRLAWDRAESGGSLAELCDNIRTIPRGALWRHNVAGDLPGDGENLDREALAHIVRANRGRRGFTYTHKLSPANWQAYSDATGKGFVINLSADSANQADELAQSGLPVVVVIPSTAPDKLHTPSGRLIVACPAQTRADVTCQSCQLCAQPGRDVVVGFKAHGVRLKKLDQKLINMVEVG